jgi:hypothetical protein
MMSKVFAQDLQIPWQTGEGADSTQQLQGVLQGGALGAGGSNITIGTIVSRATEVIFLFAGIGLFLMLLSGGFTLLTSLGDSKKLDQGKQKLTNALIGFLIIFASFWLVQATGIILGLEEPKNIFK